MKTTKAKIGHADAIIWLNRDLRLADNPALSAALADGHTPILVYIQQPQTDHWSCGAASRWWLHHSLASLQRDLQQRGSDLLIMRGDARQQLRLLAETLSINAVYRNRTLDPYTEQSARAVIDDLSAQGITTAEFTSDLLFEPDLLLKSDGTPYRVFTPFWKRMQHLGDGRPLTSAPKSLGVWPESAHKLSSDLQSLGLLPKHAWADKLHDVWQPGEAAAHTVLETFCNRAIGDYPQDRDLPSQPGTSRISAHLHFGEISARQVWYAAEQIGHLRADAASATATEAYLRQLAWREFGRHLLWHFPDTADQPMDDRFQHFPWRKPADYAADLHAWQRGQTGIPMVDAGMRELWATGWMHNRVRMIVASLLTKNLLIPWQEGARWFWDTLVDADLANNTMGWQWTAGCGADAAPYFRVFNPVTQGERFDPDGSYVRRWVPELKPLPAKWVHKPWLAPNAVIQAANIVLGETYPMPIVDLATSRMRALEAWGTCNKK